MNRIDGFKLETMNWIYDFLIEKRIKIFELNPEGFNVKMIRINEQGFDLKINCYDILIYKESNLSALSESTFDTYVSIYNEFLSLFNESKVIVI